MAGIVQNSCLHTHASGSSDNDIPTLLIRKVRHSAVKPMMAFWSFASRYS